MMKRIFLVILAFLLLILFFLYFINRKETNNKLDLRVNNKNLVQEEESFIFVPYWSFTDEISVNEYDSIIYFGISVGEDGIDTDEQGYKKIGLFSRLAPRNKKTYLALRLLDKNIQNKILNDTNFQNSISEEAILIAKEYGFKGIVLDFETSAFGFESTKKSITAFYKNLGYKISSSDLEFIAALFGDTYYRARPYDVKQISLISDWVIIMAYDFHKARLNPGPNFPLSEKSKYGYDFEMMADDFIKDITFEKIIVAFGFFGYDWALDENGVSLKEAEPLSLNQIGSRFLNNCEFESCFAGKNESEEPFVKYKDNKGYQHEVWFEDEGSVTKKMEFLNSKGIKKTAIWAYSYF